MDGTRIGKPAQATTMSPGTVGAGGEREERTRGMGGQCVRRIYNDNAEAISITGAIWHGRPIQLLAPKSSILEEHFCTL